MKSANIDDVPKCPNFITIRKKWKNEDELMRQIQHIIKLDYNTTYDNVIFLNGDNTDLRYENVVVIDETKRSIK